MKCPTKYCRNDCAPGRKICHKCRSRDYVKRNPIRVAYLHLRRNARLRGKEFTISLEYFNEFCIKTAYIKKRGRFRDCYHVDRIDETKGYVEGNLQLLKNHENIRKYYVYLNSNYNPEERKMEHYTDIGYIEKDVDSPF